MTAATRSSVAAHRAAYRAASADATVDLPTPDAPHNKVTVHDGRYTIIGSTAQILTAATNERQRFTSRWSGSFASTV